MIFANSSAPMNAQSSSSCSLEFLRVKVFVFRPTPLEMLDFNKTSYTDFVLARNEFLKLVGAPNESLKLLTIYYIIISLRDPFGPPTHLINSVRAETKSL